MSPNMNTMCSLFAPLRLTGLREAERDLSLDELPSELLQKKLTLTNRIDVWVEESLLAPLGNGDAAALQTWTDAAAVSEQLAPASFTDIGGDKVQGFLSTEQKQALETYCELRELLTQAMEMAQTASSADVAVAMDTSSKEGMRYNIAKIQELVKVDGERIRQKWGFTVPEAFLKLVKKKLRNVVGSSYASSKHELVKLVYPMHLLPSDNHAKPSGHNASITKLCSQVARCSHLCQIDDEVAIAEQESIDMLRSICTGDLTRRMMEQAKSKLTWAKPAPVNDSPTNMALGRLSKAMEALNDDAALSKAVGWCLQALGDDTMDVVKQKDKVLEAIRGWRTQCEKVTEERLTFINGTVEKELAPLKAKISLETAGHPDSGRGEDLHRRRELGQDRRPHVEDGDRHGDREEGHPGDQHHRHHLGVCTGLAEGAHAGDCSGRPIWRLGSVAQPLDQQSRSEGQSLALAVAKHPIRDFGPWPFRPIGRARASESASRADGSHSEGRDLT